MPHALVMRGWRNWQTHYLEVVAPSRAWRFKSSPAHKETMAEVRGFAFFPKNGAYSLVVKLEFVELVSRVRFSVGTPYYGYSINDFSLLSIIL